MAKLQILNDEYSLNLTFSTLATYLKYPNTTVISKGEKIYNKKRGVFQSEKKRLEEVANECGLFIECNIVRHPLSFLVEAADSICYSVMDIEDGFNKGWYNFDYIENKLSDIYGIKSKIKKLKAKKNGYGDEVTMMVNFRIYLIQRLVDLAVNNFLKNYKLISEGKYDKELINDDKYCLEERLQDFCFTEIFPKREITSLELTGHSVLTGLLDYYIDFIFVKPKDYRKKQMNQFQKAY